MQRPPFVLALFVGGALSTVGCSDAGPMESSSSVRAPDESAAAADVVKPMTALTRNTPGGFLIGGEWGPTT